MLAALVLGVAVTMLMTPRYTAQASIQIDQQADQVLGDSQDQVQPAVAYQDADRFLQTQVDVLKSRAMAVRVAQALNLFNNHKFFDQMGVSPPDPIPGVSREQQLQDATVQTIWIIWGSALPRDSRVATISFTSPDPALAAQIANSYTSEFIKSSLQRKFNSTSYARNFLAQQLNEAKAKLEQSEQDLNNYARQMGLIKTEQTNPDGSTSTGSSSVTTASLAQLNTAANQATASADRGARKNGAAWRIRRCSTSPMCSHNQAVQGLARPAGEDAGGVVGRAREASRRLSDGAAVEGAARRAQQPDQRDR